MKTNAILKGIKNSRVIRAFTSYSIANLLTALIAFLTVGWFTKKLSPDEFGKATMIWLFVSIVLMFVDSRLNTAFSIKFYKNSKQENTINIYTSLLYNLIVATIIFSIFLIAPSIVEKLVGVNISNVDILIMYISTIFMVVSGFYTNMLMLTQKSKSYFILKLIYNIFYILSAYISLFILKCGYSSYLIAYMFANGVISLLSIKFFYENYKPLARNNISLNNLKELLIIGLPLIPNSLLLMLLTWEDRYVLNIYSGLVIVGIYTVGYRFGEIMNNFLFNPLGQAISPILYRDCSQNMQRYKDTLSKVFKYYWVISYFVVIGYFTILKEVYGLIIGSEYKEGYNIIGIVLIGVVFLGITNLIGSTVVVKEETGKIFKFTAISVIINTILNFMLIPKFGMYGASVATLLSYLLNFIITLSYSQKLIFIQYDYKFLSKLTFIASICFVGELFISYLIYDKIVSIIMKIIIFIIFSIYISYAADIKTILKEKL